MGFFFVNCFSVVRSLMSKNSTTEVCLTEADLNKKDITLHYL